MLDKDNQERFIRLVGSVNRADRLQAIWNNSHPKGTAYDKLFGDYKSKEDVFKLKAKAEGFTNKVIEAFLLVGGDKNNT